MEYKKKISIVLLINIVLFGISLYVINLKSDLVSGCNAYYLSPTSYSNFFSPFCPLVIFFSNFGLLFLSTLLSLIPLYFLKEGVYKAWKKFALVVLPAIAIIIFLSPVNSPGDYVSLGYDREVASMFFSALFLIASWGIAVYHHLLKK